MQIAFKIDGRFQDILASEVVGRGVNEILIGTTIKERRRSGSNSNERRVGGGR